MRAAEGGCVQPQLTCSCCRSQALGKRRELQLTSFLRSHSSWGAKTQLRSDGMVKVRPLPWGWGESQQEKGSSLPQRQRLLHGSRYQTVPALRAGDSPVPGGWRSSYCGLAH